MVMGPDCGTAIVNGVPLGFANVIRRGPIGVVGASGTGTQEVTVRIHQLGSGCLAGARHRRPRPRRDDRRHLDAARARRARRRSRHEGHRAGVEAAGARSRGGQGAGRRRGQRQAGGRDLPRRRSRRRSRATACTAPPTWRRPPTWPSRSPRRGNRAPTAIAIADEMRRHAAGQGPRDGAEPALRARHLLRRHVLLRGATHPRRGGHQRVLQHADRRATGSSTSIAQEPGEHHHRHGRRRVHPGPPAPDDRPVAARRPHSRGGRRPDDGGRALRCRARLRLGRRPDRRAARRRRLRQGEGQGGGPPVAFIGYVCGTDQDPQNREQGGGRPEVRRRPGGVVAMPKPRPGRPRSSPSGQGAHA